MSVASCVRDPKLNMEGSKPQMSTDKSLLLLGLQLLNKGLRLPTAVVQPHIQQRLEQPGSPPLKPCVDGSPRKRQRETEDTFEGDRRAKRKMMNRVAAQNARDRKKAYVDDLERKVALLDEQNRKLLCENEQLKKQASSEREQLELKVNQSTESFLLQTLAKEGVVGLTGSAAPCVSLQQKTAPQTPLAHFWLLVSLSLWLEMNSFVQEQAALWEDLSLPQLTLLLGDQHARRPQWWGAWEQKWGPPKI